MYLRRGIFYFFKSKKAPGPIPLKELRHRYCYCTSVLLFRSLKSEIFSGVTLSHSSLKTQTCMSQKNLHFSLGTWDTYMPFYPRVRRKLTLHLFMPTEEPSHTLRDARKSTGAEMARLHYVLRRELWISSSEWEKMREKNYFHSFCFSVPRGH